MSNAPLFAGVEPLVSRQLDTTALGRKSAARAFFDNIPEPDIVASTVEAVYSRIEQNWRDLRQLRTSSSQQNWRWHKPQLKLGDDNDSQEIIFQRLLVRAATSAGRRDWSNHVPIASGIGGPSAHKHCAIDLVHQRGHRAFDFIELKIILATNNAFYAAFEIVRYGMIWLLARRAGEEPGGRTRTLLDANDVMLSVLAPAEYYPICSLADFAAGLNAGLSRIAPPDTKLVFAFEMLPRGLANADIRSLSPMQILDFADKRGPLPR